MFRTIINLFKKIKINNIQHGNFCKTTNVFSKYYEKVESMPTKYGGKSHITILPGIGIGPEIMTSTLKILNAAEAPLTYEIMNTDPEDELEEKFNQVLISIRRNKVALKGNIEVKSKDPLVTSRNVALRKTLDLFVYVVPIKTFPGLKNKFGEIDVVLLRQNTEGEYLMLEHEPVPGVAESLKVITRYNSERIAEYAFRYAVENKRKLVTVAHMADVQPLSEGIFVEAASRVHKKYPEIELNVKEVGVAAVQLCKNPKDFDMILATNLNGSMLINFFNGMIGGPALSSGVNLGENGIAVFEPGARNKGSSIVGQGKANPVAMLFAAIEALKHLGYHKCANTIYKAVYKTIVLDQIHTPDLGGSATTEDVTNNIIKIIRVDMGRDGEKKENPDFKRIKFECSQFDKLTKAKCPEECLERK